MLAANAARAPLRYQRLPPVDEQQLAQHLARAHARVGGADLAHRQLGIDDRLDAAFGVPPGELRELQAESRRPRLSGISPFRRVGVGRLRARRDPGPL